MYASGLAVVNGCVKSQKNTHTHSTDSGFHQYYGYYYYYYYYYGRLKCPSSSCGSLYSLGQSRLNSLTFPRVNRICSVLPDATT